MSKRQNTDVFWLIRRAFLLFAALVAWGVISDAQARHRPGHLANAKQDAWSARLPEGVSLIHDVPYRQGHDRWTLDLYLPEGLRQGPKRPAVVLIHGGAWRIGSKRNGLMVSTASRLAAEGYVCVSINYRLIQHERFPAPIQDVKTAVRWLRAHAADYNIDPERIAAFGNSAGAHLAAMLGLAPQEAGFDTEGPWPEQSSRVQAVITVAAPMDLTYWLDQDPDGQRHQIFYRGPVEGFRDQAEAASPITYVDASMPPFLVIHGGRDGLVPKDQAEAFVAAGQAAGAAQLTFLFIENAGHNVFNAARSQTYPATTDFLAEYLPMTRLEASP